MSEEKKSEKKNWIKSLFVKETDVTPEVAVEEKNATNVGANPTHFNYSNASNTVNVAPQMNGMFDEKFLAHLLDVIEKNNLDGMDYFEFSKSKKNLDNAPGFTEQMKFQSAFGVLAASTNLTKERLLETADFYIKVLEKEETEFENSKNAEIEAQVSSRLNDASEKEAMIAKKTEDINKLQIEITQLRTEIGVLQNEAQNSQFKIESTAKNFKYTLDSVKNQIVSDKNNIQNFIQ